MNEIVDVTEAADCLKALGRNIVPFSKAVKELADNRPLAAAEVIGARKRLQTQVLSQLRKCEEMLRKCDLIDRITSEADRKRMDLGSLVEKQLAAADLQVTSGSWPSYEIAFIIRLEIRPEGSGVLIDGKKVKAAEPEDIVSHVKRMLETLVKPDYNAAEFGKHLATAYSSLSSQVTAPGGFVDIRAVQKEVQSLRGDKKSKLSDRQFAVDLYRYIESDNSDKGDVGLELSPAQDASDGIYIPSRKGGNYVAALRLRTSL